MLKGGVGATYQEIQKQATSEGVRQNQVMRLKVQGGIKILEPGHLEQHSAWAEDDSGEFLFPVRQIDPLPEDLGSLFLKADFLTGNGMTLQGYVVDDFNVYAACIFVGGEKFRLNLHLVNSSRQALQRLCDVIGIGLENCFPIRYIIAFRRRDGTILSGVFDFSE